MTDVPSYVPPLISAAAVLGGVVIGTWATGRREWLREKSAQRLESTYAAILLLTYLDRLITGCVDVAYVDGTAYGRPAGEDGETNAITASAPTFDPMAIGVQWRAVPTSIAYSVLSLPHRLEIVSRTVSQIWENDSPPDYSDMFWTRQAKYAELGLEIAEVSRQLRLSAELTEPPNSQDEWNRESALRDKKAAEEKEREAYYARVQDFDAQVPYGGQRFEMPRRLFRKTPSGRGYGDSSAASRSIVKRVGPCLTTSLIHRALDGHKT